MVQAGLENCKNVQIIPLGCYNDVRYNRGLSDYIMNGRDYTTENFVAPEVQWGNYKEWLDNFVCKCAQAALKRGYTHIGAQFFGECFGGFQQAFDKHGQADPSRCINTSYKQVGDPQKCTSYMGKNNANFVYQIHPYPDLPACNVTFEPRGCYKDYRQEMPDRPLPDYILNDRDPTHRSWSGIMIDWMKWNTYMPNLVCRCANQARSLGYKYFGLQFYGECWAGNNQTEYLKDGVAPASDCIVRPGVTCPLRYTDLPCQMPLCVGVHQTNMVYEITG